MAASLGERLRGSSAPCGTGGEMDDATKKTVIDLLYKELEHVRRKSLMVDDFFFKLLSIGVIPFLGILAYAILKHELRVVVCAVPFLSILGTLVVAVLSVHYSYCGSYGSFLERRINSLVGTDVLIESSFGRVFYGSAFTIVRVSYVLSFLLLLLLNFLAWPLIDHMREEFLQFHPSAPGLVAFSVRHFWPLTLGFVGVTSSLCLVTLYVSARRGEALASRDLLFRSVPAARELTPAVSGGLLAARPAGALETPAPAHSNSA